MNDLTLLLMWITFIVLLFLIHYQIHRIANILDNGISIRK